MVGLLVENSVMKRKGRTRAYLLIYPQFFYSIDLCPTDIGHADIPESAIHRRGIVGMIRVMSSIFESSLTSRG